MAARALEHNGPRRPVRALPFSLETSDIEAAKWVAFAAMLIAHGAEYIGGVKSGPYIEVGRLAFPLFTLAFAFAIAGGTHASAQRACWGIGAYAVAAQAFTMYVRQELAPLNVLFTFASAAGWLWAPALVRWEERALLRFTALVVSFVAEFSLPGLALTVLAVRFAQAPHARYGLAWVASLGTVCLLEGSATALVAPVMFFGLVRMNLAVPRLPGFFGRAYVAQFVVFAIARVFT